MRKLKHSKFRNSAFLFELLVRQVTAEILDNCEQPIAEGILRKYFAPKTELGKELKLYQLLLKQTYVNEEKAKHFIELVVDARKKLNANKLRAEKYTLVKEIREAFVISEFMKSPISNYRTIASIYKVFENEVSDETFQPDDVVSAKFTLIEHIVRHEKKEEKETVVESFTQQETDLRILSYRILLEKFNDKYSSLSDEQKTLLREYINNVSNTTSLRDYISKQVPIIKKRLVELSAKIDDDVTSIKLQETLNQLDRIRKAKKITDNHVSALMMCYELVKEIENVTD